MPLRHLVAIVLSSAMLLVALACSTESESGSDTPVGPTDSTDGSDRGTATPSPTPELRLEYPGMALDLSTDDFWDFAWKWSEVNCAQGSRCRTSNDSGIFSVTLGDTRPIDGIDFYEVILSGEHMADSGAVDLAPAWAYLTIDGPLLLGSDGRTSVTLFDARTGEWTGSGFFSRFGAVESHVAADVSVSGEHPLSAWSGFRAGPAVSVARSDSQTMCEIIEGRRICPNDQAFTLVENQYYREGAGPLGYTHRFSMSFSGGGFSSSTSSEEVVSLVASSLRGDSSSVVKTPSPAPSTRAPVRPTPSRGGTAPPLSYVGLVDDTGTLRIELPSTWAEVRTDPVTSTDGSEWATIIAAPDLVGFYGSWDGPGMMVQVGPEGLLIPDLAAWLEAYNATNLADCTLATRDSSGGLESMTLEDCGGQGTAMISVATQIGMRTVAIIFQFREQDDFEHFTRLYESLTVCDRRGCLLE